MWSSILAGMLLTLAALSSSVEQPPELPVRVFFANPRFQSPALSPSGNAIAVIQSHGDLQLVLAGDVDGGELKLVSKNDRPEMRLSWLQWANEGRLLISAQMRDPEGVGMRSRATRLLGMDRDGGSLTWLGRDWPGSGALRAQFEDRILHRLPTELDGVLIELNLPSDDGAKVMRLNVDSGHIQPVQGPIHDVTRWHADAWGNVRAGVAYQDGRYQVWARIEPDARLMKVIDHGPDETGPLFGGFHADPGRLYVVVIHGDRMVLREFDLKSRELGPIVFSHPEVDVDEIVRDPAYIRGAVGVRFTVDRAEVHYFDEATESLHRALRSQLETQFSAPITHAVASASIDGNRQLLEVSSEIQPPVYYLYDHKENLLRRILEERPGLEPEDLASTKRVTYEARDGLRIPAYLTLPRGRGGARLPAIALIHGGPWARDSIRWDPEVQVLANRGFAVFQMNFRGSTGHGRKHLHAGYREWGEKIQDDITDGVRWLIAEGIADPGRIGIAGASFGGYAALMGLVKTPELYRAGAAYAAVTDIELLLRDDKWYQWGSDWHGTMIGGGRGDKNRLRESSPLRRAGEIGAPVLLGHGENDERIHVRQSRRMSAALRKAGKEHDYLEFHHEIHGFLLEANRMKWYERWVTFFEEHLAPPPEVSAAP